MQLQRQAFVFCSALCLLTSFIAVPGLCQLQSSTMELVSNSSEPECAADRATTLFKARSLLDCERRCATQKTKCYAGNYYSDTKTCELYNFKPKTFTTSRKNCKMFKNSKLWDAAPSDALASAPRDCADIRALNLTTSGIYTVYIGSDSRPLQVYCDMTTTSAGWTVLQRRQNGIVDFYLNWTDYQTGFGNINGGFWIGNDNLHLLTSAKRYKLRVDLTAFDLTTAYAEFSNFTVASAADKYRLTSVGAYSGTATDSLSYHVGQNFTTKDQDNDLHSFNCAVLHKGAWWYKDCAYSNLNGYYHTTQTVSQEGVGWWYWKNNWESMKRVEMKISPYV